MYNKYCLSDISQVISVDHLFFLDIASEEGDLARQSNERPAGAVLVKCAADGREIVSRSHEQCRSRNDPVATAEMDCIRGAGRRNDQADLTLYSSRYPDMLCAGTLLQFSIGALVIGLSETNSPALDLLSTKGLAVTFVPHIGCEKLLDEAAHE